MTVMVNFTHYVCQELYETYFHFLLHKIKVFTQQTVNGNLLPVFAQNVMQLLFCYNAYAIGDWCLRTKKTAQSKAVYSYFTDVVEALCCHWLINQLLAADTHKGLFQFLQKILMLGKGIKDTNSIKVLINAT